MCVVNVNRRYGVTDFVVGGTGHVTGRVADYSGRYGRDNACVHGPSVFPPG